MSYVTGVCEDLYRTQVVDNVTYRWNMYYHLYINNGSISGLAQVFILADFIICYRLVTVWPFTVDESVRIGRSRQQYNQ